MNNADYDNDDASDSSDTHTTTTTATTAADQVVMKKISNDPSKMKRRSSIRAEPLRLDGTNNAAAMLASNKDNTESVSKRDEEAERIRHILKECLLFRELDESQLAKIEGAMFSVQKKDGDVIIQQGEDGDNFYILDDGSVDVYIKRDGEVDSRLVASYGPGDSFGELAIMYNAPRAATCKATSDVRLWALDRNTFKLIVMTTTIERRESFKNFLTKVPILSELSEYEILTVADALQEETFPNESLICKEGEKGDKFYIIKEGNVICKKGGNEVASLASGSYFGEIALITSKKRQASVIANGEVKVLYLDKRTFNRVMGNLMTILQRNMTAYNMFQASNI